MTAIAVSARTGQPTEATWRALKNPHRAADGTAALCSRRCAAISLSLWPSLAALGIFVCVVTALAMLCPFDVREKQALLEALGFTVHQYVQIQRLLQQYPGGLTVAELADYDAIIIGTGQSGPALAQALAAEGQRVAIMERRDFGGSCVNHGCIPTKAYVASARVAHQARTASDYGVAVGGEVQVDLKQVKARKDELVDESSGGL